MGARKRCAQAYGGFESLALHLAAGRPGRTARRAGPGYGMNVTSMGTVNVRSLRFSRPFENWTTAEPRAPA